jgi:hypothetical protein
VSQRTADDLGGSLRIATGSIRVHRNQGVAFLLLPFFLAERWISAVVISWSFP